MMTNLFRGYLAASDRDFVTYILRKKDEYEDGEDITDISLMSLALKRWKMEPTLSLTRTNCSFECQYSRAKGRQS